MIGGMPEVVVNFEKSKNLSSLQKLYHNLWETYRMDIREYASNRNEKRVTAHIVDHAHFYLDQRIKFQHFANSNYKSRKVGEAFRRLDDAGLIKLIYPTTDSSFPLKLNVKKSPRLQFLDTGLVNYAFDFHAHLLGIDDLSSAYKGSLVPLLVYQEIIANQSDLTASIMYWVREKKQSQAEVDLLITVGQNIVPVEI